jgi:hypothetical protein
MEHAPAARTSVERARELAQDVVIEHERLALAARKAGHAGLSCVSPALASRAELSSASPPASISATTFKSRWAQAGVIQFRRSADDAGSVKIGDTQVRMSNKIARVIIGLSRARRLAPGLHLSDRAEHRLDWNDIRLDGRERGPEKCSFLR